jgi:hypothetical protein
VLHDTGVQYFDMNTVGQKLSQVRFGAMLLLFRMTGIPFKMEKMSTIYAIYMMTVIISGITSYLGMFVDVYIHRDDLRRAMTTVRMIIPYTNAVWIFSNCR